MKSEKDLMYQYIKQNDLQFYYSLSPLGNILYLMKLEETLSFRLYVLRQRIHELFELIIGVLRK